MNFISNAIFFSFQWFAVPCTCSFISEIISNGQDN